MYTMGPVEIRTIIERLRLAEKVAATLDIPKPGGLNDIEWNIGQALKYLLNAAISPIQIDQQTRASADPASVARPERVP